MPFRLSLELLEDRCVLAFIAPVDYHTGGGRAFDVVAADFNDDSYLDLATANNDDGTVSLLLSDGHGGFGDAKSFVVGNYPRSVAVGDFDEDGKLDLATANQLGHDVSVLLGHGDGTFGTVQSVGNIGSPLSVAVGDFNSDGHLDLGITSYGYGFGYYGWASVHEGDGHGNFAVPKVTYLAQGIFESSVAIDLDGDGADDFVTANTFNGPSEGAVHVLHGDRSGYLQPASVLVTGKNAYDVAVGYVNNDNILDIVTANSYAAGVSVLFGNRLGEFGAPQDYAVGDWPESVVLGDFSGDGNVDIAYSAASVSVLPGNGDGTFSAPVQSPTGESPLEIVAGDLDGDGWLDVATGNFFDTVSVLINDHSWGPVLPSVSVNLSVSAGTEAGLTIISVTATASAAVSGDQSVTLDVSGAGIEAGDYTLSSSTITILAGQTTGTVTFSVKNDLVVEENEIATLTISNPSPGLALGMTTTRNITITDNDSATVSILSLLSAAEPATNGKFRLMQSAVASTDTVVNYTVAGTATPGSDYAPLTETATILAGQTTADINVGVFSDAEAESTETVIVTLSGFGPHDPQITMSAVPTNLTATVQLKDAPRVVSRHLVYNNSAFDGSSPGSGAADDAAIATDKSPLLPGGTATLSNYSSYSHGINGIVVDFAGSTAAIVASDYSFRVGNDNSPGSWSAASGDPTLSIRSGAGVGGSDRLTLVWPDGAIKNQWLQVTLAANAHTGLAAPDVFYFGNAVGESGDSAANAVVNSSDELAARNHPQTFLNLAALTNPYDFNRDGFVNATDQILARSNSTTLATAIKLISVPSGAQAAMADGPYLSHSNNFSLADGSIAVGISAFASIAAKPTSLSVFEFVSQLPLASLEGTDADAVRLPLQPPSMAVDRIASADQELDMHEHLYDLIAADLIETMSMSRSG